MSEILVVLFLLACFFSLWVGMVLNAIRNVDPMGASEFVAFTVYAYAERPAS